LAYSPAHEREFFESWTKSGFKLYPQSEGDLGRRMADFFEQHLARSGRVVLVGTDSPTMPIEFVERAFEALSDADIVIGPACDGGYYLIGCRPPIPAPIFEGLAWGEATVLGQTLDRLHGDRRLKLLPPWYDVDTLADLDILANHVRAMRR